MSTPTVDVVVTGLGATTPLGGDVPSTWEALLVLLVPALLVDADGRGLHDRLTDTAVVRD